MPGSVEPGKYDGDENEADSHKGYDLVRAKTVTDHLLYVILVGKSLET